MPSCPSACALSVPAACLLAAAVAGQVLPPANANPYRLEPFHADFPVALEYPPSNGAEYVRTRRQILERLAANLQGNVRPEAWRIATEFYWRAPDDAVEPLIEAMDRAMSDPAFGDVARNRIEAMGRMAREEFDPALRRALQHKNPVVQQAAFAALGTCGTTTTLREIAGAFPQMDGRARGAWLRGVRTRLGDVGVDLLAQVMNGPFPAAVRDQVLKEALQLPPAQASRVLRGRWPDAVGEFQAIIAGVLHAAGDTAGTVWLHEALGSEDLGKLVFAVRHCTFGAPGELREALLRASTHLRTEVRLEVAKTLVRVPGEDVADVYEVLASPDEPWDTRALALRELTRRGRTGTVTVLLEELATAAGTRLQSLVNQLSASGDPRAVPVLLERFRSAPAGESRPFLQALSQNHTEASARALFTLFRGPELVVGRGANGDMTTRNYLPMMLMNVRGAERVLLAEYRALPREEWRLRAPLLPVLAGIAADRNDAGLRAELIAPVREVLFDREELPQMRVLALNLMTLQALTIDDVLALKNGHRQEATGLRALIADFLLDAF
jgi:HEAT repeat protein